VHPAPVLEVSRLSVRLSRAGRPGWAIRDVSLAVARGEIVALVGESGSGKSTLGLAAQGLLPGDADPEVTGSIRVCGVELAGAGAATLRRARRRDVRAVFQDPLASLNPTMRVGRQLAEAADGAPTESDLAAQLDDVGIPEPRSRLRSYPHELSGGQRQRVMIAMAMASRPALVFADEPTTALDVTVQAQVLALFGRLRKRSGTAFVFITHDLAVAASIADRIVVMYAGTVVEDGPVRAVTAEPAHPYTAALLDARFDLDVDKRHRLPTLPGGPPLPTSEPPGCLFAERCLLVDDPCRAGRPALQPVRRRPGTAACVRQPAVSAGLWRRTATAWPEAVQPAAPTGEDGVLLRVGGVGKRFARRGGAPLVALDDVDLEVGPGEAVALVGESGSGKSTLLRVVAGLTPADGGSVRYTGGDRPQMVHQDPFASLTPWLPVHELVAERLRSHDVSRAERRERVLAVLERVGLPGSVARLRPGQLSGGQRQRVAVARAVVVPPRLLLCDEPVSAMDVSLAAGVLNLLESLRRELGMAMLFVTHDLAAARFVAERIVVMRSGQVVESGPSDAIVGSPRHSYTRELLASMPGRPGVPA
jgi:peptide/nickel transport system ATP-binding protein